MSLRLTVKSPVQTFTEPLTVAQAKAHLNLPTRLIADPAEDALIATFIQAAREVAESRQFQNRDLVRKQWDLTCDYWEDHRCGIPLRADLVSVDLVKYRDSAGVYTTLADSTDYVVNIDEQPGLLTPAYNVTWPAFTPWPTGAVLIRFTSGLAPDDAWWNDAGARVKIGMLYLVEAWFNNRLPYEEDRTVIAEYPYTVQACLGLGGVVGAV